MELVALDIELLNAGIDYGVDAATFPNQGVPEVDISMHLIAICDQFYAWQSNLQKPTAIVTDVELKREEKQVH